MISLNSMSVSDQVDALGTLTDHLTDVLDERGGSYDKEKALLVTARRAGVSISEMSYVVSYAKAERRITVDSEKATFSLANSDLDTRTGV